jgi:hypothetical protein
MYREDPVDGAGGPFRTVSERVQPIRSGTPFAGIRGVAITRLISGSNGSTIEPLPSRR